MTIEAIYERFGISPNLQEHMLRVSAVVTFLFKHWIGTDAVDWKMAKKVALLHDLGNIVKFDFVNHPEFLGDEQKNIVHWQAKQQEVIAKYGSDDHEVTKAMLSELNVDQKMTEIILNKSFANSVATKDSSNWELKILYYADLLVLPFGIGTLEARLDDVRDRMPKYTSRPDFPDLVAACVEIEKQIAANLNVSVSEINDANVAIDRNDLAIEV